MECVAFHLFNNHVGKHIMDIFQVDKVNTHQAQTEIMVGREHEESFSHMNWH